MKRGNMKKLCIIFFCFYGFGLTCFAAEAPCGIDKEAERIITLAKSELGIYSGVVTPFVNRILDSGGMDIAPADAMLDQLTVQAKKDGYNLVNVVANLKKFNRLVVNCKEYPEYVKRKKGERELAAKEKELKRQANLARLKEKEEEERLAKIENERLEKEKEIQNQIDLENEKKRQEEERIARIEEEFQNKVNQKAASLYEGYILKVPSALSYNSLTDPSYRGMVGMFSKLLISGNQYIVTLKELKDLNYKVITADLLFNVIKKRKKYNVVFSREDFINIEMLARTEEEYLNR
jgi:hypothetical protein